MALRYSHAFPPTVFTVTPLKLFNRLKKKGVADFERTMCVFEYANETEICTRMDKLPDDRVLVVNVLGSTAQFADQSFHALVRFNDVGVDVGNAGTETINGIWFVICL